MTQKEQSKMVNPEKLATLCTQDNQTKKRKTHHNMRWTLHTQAITNNASKTRGTPLPSPHTHTQNTGGKNEPNIVLGGDRSGHHNTKLRT
jgi:hypothetical protein